MNTHTAQLPKVLPSGLEPDSQYVSGETGEDFFALRQEYIAEFQPATARERFFVDTLIRSEWVLRRLFNAEAQLWICNSSRDDHSNGLPLGVALDKASPNFMRLQRRITLAERAYRDALTELDRLRAMRPAPAGALETEPSAVVPVKPAAAPPANPEKRPAARLRRRPIVRAATPVPYSPTPFFPRGIENSGFAAALSVILLLSQAAAGPPPPGR